MRPNLFPAIAVLALTAAAGAAACGGGGAITPTATPTAAAAPQPAAENPPVLPAQRLAFDGRLYRQGNTTMWYQLDSLEQVGTLELNGETVEVYAFRDGPSGYLATRQQTSTGDVWLEWLDAGENAPGAPPGATEPGAPPAPGNPLPVTPVLPDNPAPDPDGVVSATAVPPVGTAIARTAVAEPGQPVDPAWAPTPDPSAPVAAARADLAARLRLAEDEIIVVSVEAVEWPDGCLGLGGPNEARIAMMVPGFRVTLEAGGTQYVYRTGLGQVRLEP